MTDNHEVAEHLIRLHQTVEQHEDVVDSKIIHPQWFDFWRGDIPDNSWPWNLWRSLPAAYQMGMHPPYCSNLNGEICRIVMCPDYGGDLPKRQIHTLMWCTYQAVSSQNLKLKTDSSRYEGWGGMPNT